MPRFESDHFFPRISGSDARRVLVTLHGKPADELVENPFDVRRSEFHPLGARRIEDSSLLAWREELNEWAWDRGFPARMDQAQRSAWDVDLGTKLLGDVGDIPELLHPDVWCWLATFLLPHFVVHRWDWPTEKDGEPPTTREPWARFGSDLRNGLRLTVQRILTFGADLADRASEQEFQSIQYRPAFGSDRRVAKLIMEGFIKAADDPESNYGRNGGQRALDCNYACIELRLINSLQPLCFAADDEIAAIVDDVIDRLPDLRPAD